MDSRLLEIARRKVVAAAKRCAIVLKQTFAAEGKTLQRQAGGYAHAKQFKRLRRVVKRQRTILGVLIREAKRKLQNTTDNALALNSLNIWLERAERVRAQQRQDKNKLYALHAPEVECIGKGKAESPTSSASKSVWPSPTSKACWWLQGATGDALHALCCAVGYNLRWLLRAVVRLGLKGLFLCLFWLAYWVRFALMTLTRVTISDHSASMSTGFTPAAQAAGFLKSQFRRAD